MRRVVAILVFRLKFLLASACLVVPSFAPAQQLQRLRGHVPELVSKLTSIGQLPDTAKIDLVIGLPLRNVGSLDSLERDIYQPGSFRYLQYLTPGQYVQRFCPTQASYAALVGFARTNGLSIVSTARNRKFIHVRAAAGVVNKVFHVTLKLYRHPNEDRLFYAPDIEPTVELRTPILHITGLDNLHVPGRFSDRLLQKKLGLGDPQYAGGSGSSGSYAGMDFRAAYAPGVSRTGKSQVVGILELSGYTPSDVTTYEAKYGITPVPLQNAYLDGYTGGGPNLESAADIELVISMAPGLSKVVIYGAPYNNAGVHDILNEMANPTKGEPLPYQISSSYYFFYDQNVYDALKQLVLQGQAFFVASGDYGSYNEMTGAGAFPPSDHPLVTSVGGTALQTSGPGGIWVSETAVSFSGGGYSPWGGDPQFVLPYWQSGMDFTLSQGSTTTRNAPDVAMVAINISVYFGGAWQGFAGTSASAPLWAGFWALANEQAAANGRARIGFANPPLYSIGKGPDYATSFHDIITGNNFNPTNPTKYSAVVGYDLVTGWGTPNGPGLIDALTRPRLGLCQLHPQWCYAVFDPFWWLKCPACTIDILIHQGDDIKQVTVLEATGREVGKFQRLPVPVVQGGVTYNYRITLRPKKETGYVLSAEVAPGREISGGFRPAYIVRRSKLRAGPKTR